MITYLRLKNGQISAYKETPFNLQRGYTYLDTEDIVDEFSYIENGVLKRKTQAEIDAIIEQRLQSEYDNEMNIVLNIRNTQYLLLQGGQTEIENYRTFITDLETERLETTPNFDSLEEEALKFEINRIDDTIDLTGKTLSELRTIYADIKDF